jgi:hypothetical protein
MTCFLPRTAILPALACAAFVSCALATNALAASGTSVRSEYTTSLFGLTLARSSFESTIGRDGFDVRGTLSSSGVASLFDDTHATASVKGRFADERPLPDSYVVDYVSGDKKKATRVSFSGGAVVRAENSPPVKTDRPDWVPVEKAHLAGVVDPISATLVRADALSKVCDRTIRIFDGAMRADLKLTHAGYGRASLPGFSGETVTCNARFVPVSGYRKGNSSIRFMSQSTGIAIAFAPIADSGVYAPVEASVETRIGTVRVKAVRFEAMD